MIKVAYNFVASEAGWFACVLGAAHGKPWIGPLVVIALVAIHLRLVQKPGAEVSVMLAAVLIGFAAESSLVVSGFVSYPNGAWFQGFAPYWILAMWVMFATTLNTSLKCLQGRIPLAMLLGAIFGPLAYLAGEGLGAITFEERSLAIAALALVWAICMPLLSMLAARWNSEVRIRKPEYILDDWRANSGA